MAKKHYVSIKCIGKINFNFNNPYFSEIHYNFSKIIEIS